MALMETKGGRLPAVTVMVLAASLLLGAAAASAQQEAVTAELAFGTGVERADRTLTGEAESFGAEVGKVFCLARVVGAPAETEIIFAWYHEGKTMARVPLTVRSADFRTWSSKNIMPAWTGAWEVKLLDDTGRVLASGSFTVQ